MSFKLEDTEVIKDNVSYLIDGRSVKGTTIPTNAPSIEIGTGAVLGSNFKEEILKYITEQFAKKPIVKHECHSCGATLEIDAKKHIFVCKYCGSIYAINTSMVNDKGDY